MKIYHKRNFKYGIFFLVLSLISMWLLVVRWEELNTMRIVKDIACTIISFIIGVIYLVRSLNRELSEEHDREEDSERNHLVTLKAQSKAFTICFYACMILAFLFILLYIWTRIEGLLWGFVGLGLLSTFMFITIVVLSFYYNSKY